MLSRTRPSPLYRLARANLELPKSRRRFHASPSSRLFGINLPTPSNEPLAGTMADGSGPPLFFIAQVVVGLPAVLWAYKCLMLVLFQRRITYLPSVPPGTKNESLKDGERTSARDASLSGMQWEEVETESEVPTRWLRRRVRLKGLELSWKGEGKQAASNMGGGEKGQQVVIVYLQGNAGTPLLRAPLFRQLLRPLPHPRLYSPSKTVSPPSADITIFAFAPRSFWLSTSSTPTENTVLADYAAAFAYARRKFGNDAAYVLYGHSLGGAAAVLLLEKLQQRPLTSTSTAAPTSSPTPAPPSLVNGLILENPLPSIPYMVRALYPQRWLPYHWLGPFAFDKWDAIGRLRSLASSAFAPSFSKRLSSSPSLSFAPPTTPTLPSLWIRSSKDEIIPHGSEDGVRLMHSDWVELAGKSRTEWVDVEGALHDTAYTEGKWRTSVKGFLEELGREKAVRRERERETEDGSA